MLALRDLHKTFARTRALDGLSFELRPGEVFALLGPNGAGKTTAMSIATGLLRPDSGTCVLMDRTGGEIGPTTDPRVRARMGLCPQANAVYPQLTARENVRLFAGLAGLRGLEQRTGADAALEAVGLSDRAGDRAAGFSGGMLRRLNLAVAIVHRPDVVLLDEPTAGVDPHSRRRLRDLIEAERARGASVLLTTHDMDDASRLADRVGIIDHGKIIAAGTVDELVGIHGGDSRVRVERASGIETITTGRAHEVVGTLDLRPDAADPVTGLHVERPDLEAVFLNLTGRSLRDG